MARTSRQRAALRKAQLASAKKRRGRGRKAAKYAAIGGTVAAASAIGYATYKGVKKKRSSDFREDVRHNYRKDKLRQHAKTHLWAHRNRDKLGKPGRNYHPKTLDAQHAFVVGAARRRTAQRRAMTSKQRRASVPRRKRK